MSRPKSLQIVFDDFSGGHWGVRDPSMVAANQWYGSNVVVYSSGLLGPRKGLQYIDVLPADDGLDGLGFVPVQSSSDGRTIYVTTGTVTSAFSRNGGTMSTFDPYDSSGSALSYTYDISPTTGADGYVYVSGRWEEEIYLHDPPSTTTSIATPAGTVPTLLTRWNERLLFVDWASTARNRLYYSGEPEVPNDKQTWGADSYYEIGDGAPITALIPLGPSLYVGKPTGWWVLTGSPGTTAQVRQVSEGVGPAVRTTPTAAVHDSGVVAFVTQKGEPAVFNGVSVTVFSEMLEPGGSAFEQVVALKDGWTLFAAYDDTNGPTALLFHRGAFFPVKFDLDIGRTLWHSTPGSHQAMGEGLGQTGVSDLAFMVKEPIPDVFAWIYDADGPGSFARFDAIGDGTDDPFDTFVYLPEYRNPRGMRMRVRSVLVQFRRFEPEQANEFEDIRNHFKLRVRSLDTYESTYADTADQVFDVAKGEGDETRRFNFDAEYGEGFQLRFSDLRNVGLRRVVVLVDEAEDWGA